MPLSRVDITPLSPRKFIKVATICDIASLTPFLTPEVYDSGVMRLMYPTFVTRDEKTRLMPWALQSWKLVDSTTADIPLQPGTKFHDGNPASGADPKFSFDFLLKWNFPVLGRVSDAVMSTEITDGLVPELQRRGLVRKAYAHKQPPRQFVGLLRGQLEESLGLCPKPRWGQGLSPDPAASRRFEQVRPKRMAGLGRSC